MFRSLEWAFGIALAWIRGKRPLKGRIPLSKWANERIWGEGVVDVRIWG